MVEDGMHGTYPSFSGAEMTRRRELIEAAMAARGVRHLVAYGANRSGSAVQWLSGWPVTREAALVLTPGETDALFVQFYNHVPTARILAADAEVHWGGESTAASVAAELERRGAEAVGLLGPIGYKARDRLAAIASLVDLDPAYTRLRMIKSSEELAWLREGARLSDRAVETLRDGARPGMNERHLGALVESAYLGEGGTNHIHYFGVTSMADPARCVPAQWPSTRHLAPGDVLSTEISASWWGYPGQVLRTMTIAAEPTPLYRELHDVAEAALEAVLAVLRPGADPASVVEAASVIEDAGFTTYDDLVHGFGGGYLPPVIGSRSRTIAPLPDLVFEAGMTVVVQPNVITPDERAGVQTGELVAIGPDGAERLHTAPPGLWRAA